MNAEVICVYINKINGISGVGNVNENKRHEFLHLSHVQQIC
jgi:hypothetical protein